MMAVLALAAGLEAEYPGVRVRPPAGDGTGTWRAEWESPDGRTLYASWRPTADELNARLAAAFTRVADVDELQTALLPATCAQGHVYTPQAISISDRGRLTTSGALLKGRNACPVCGSEGTIPAGTYTLVGGVVHREDAGDG